MKRLFLTAIFLAVSSPAMAAGYGMAGCGLGSIIINKQAGFLQVFAATTNASSGSQTFGITSGTSNCAAAEKAPNKQNKPRGQKKAERKVYLHYNLAQVKADAARGEGDYIEGLASLFGCQDPLSGSYAEFATLSQQHHNSIFSSNSADTVYDNYENVITSAKLGCAES